jgi:Sec7-like guanine-nucleotide exchange factor
MPKLAITTGINELLKEKEAYWFADIISSYLPTLKQQNETFAIVDIKVNEGKISFSLCSDISNSINKKIYVNEEIPSTDYIIESKHKFYVVLIDTSEGVWTYILMLPQEYIKEI